MDDFLLFVAIGFAAQLADGAIGMAHGVVGTTFLISLGASPTTASAAVHAAEVFTTGVSGTAHWRLGNTDRSLVIRLALPGVLGGVAGAYAVAEAPNDIIRPLVSLYLLAVGAVILWRAWQRSRRLSQPPKHVGTLGLAGGFLDAVGVVVALSLRNLVVAPGCRGGGKNHGGPARAAG